MNHLNVNCLICGEEMLVQMDCLLCPNKVKFFYGSDISEYRIDYSILYGGDLWIESDRLCFGYCVIHRNIIDTKLVHKKSQQIYSIPQEIDPLKFRDESFFKKFLLLL